MQFRCVFVALSATVCLTLSSSLSAQAEKASFPVTEVSLEPMSGGQGDYAAYGGDLPPGGEAHLIVSNLSMFQPMAIIAKAADRDHPVKVRFGKFGWKEDAGGGTTGGDLAYRTKFRTQGDLLITVSAPNGGAARIGIWRGPEQEPPMKPILVDGDTSGSGFPKWLLYALGGVVLVGGAFYLGRRQKGAVQ